MRTIGTRIREFRKKRNMSLSRLADGICSPYTLLRIEKGEVSPSLDLTTKICGKLSIPIEYLLHHEEDPLTKKINYAMNLCREMVYDNELDGLQMTIQHLEDLTKGIQVESSVPAFIEWHKAILVHQKDGNPEKAEKMLRNLLPPSLTLVNELEIGIANSLGLVLISAGNLQEKIEETKRRIKQSNEVTPHNNSANISVETYTSTKDHR